MSTEQEILDLKLRLSAEEREMQPIKRWMRDLDRMAAQAKKFANVKLHTNFIDEATRRKIMGANAVVDTLSRSMMDTARAAKTAGKLTANYYGQLTSDIQHEVDKLNNATSKKQRKDQEVKLRRLIKYADAVAAVYNSSAERREQIETSLRERIAKVDDAAEADRLKKHKRTEDEIIRSRHRTQREIARGLKDTYGHAVGFGRGAAMYGAVGAAATGYAAKSAMTTRMRTDTAEVNLQTFGQMSKAQVQEMRKSWGDASAIKYGLDPEKMIDAFTEVIKAGIPESKAKAVTETILNSAAGLDLDIKNTTKYAARVATLTQDMKNLDPEKLKSIMNASAVAARESGADANEIIAANRRASGVFATSKMSPEQLSAFTAAGISAEMPSGKTGTFLGFMVNELAGAKNARGQRGRDLGAAANLLGFGSKDRMAKSMADDPAEALMQIFNKLGDMPEQKVAKITNLIGMREWRDELGTFVEIRDDVGRILKEIGNPKNKNFAEEAAQANIRSLKGRWKSLVTSFKLLWEQIGKGLEPTFGEIATFLTEWTAKLDKDLFRRNVEAIFKGFVEGLGFNNWTELMRSAFGDPGKMKDYAVTFGEFAKGFGQGIKVVAETISTIFVGLAKAFGVNSADPAAMGKFVAEFLGFAIALKFIAPVVGVLVTIGTVITNIAKALGAKKLAEWALPKIPGVATRLAPGVLGPLGAMGLIGDGRETNSADKVKGITDAIKEEREKKKKLMDAGKGDGRADPLFTPTSYLGDKLDTLGAKIERASFMGGLTDFSSRNRTGGGGIQYAVNTAGGSGGGSGGGLGPSKLVSGIGTPDALFKSTPGGALPNFGVGSGGIIKRDKIPSFSGGGGSAVSDAGLSRSKFEQMFAGTGLAGSYDQVVAQAKANGISPALLAGVMAHETGKGKVLSGNNPGGIMDPATGHMKKMQFSDINSGIAKTASVVAKNFNRAGGDLDAMGQKYAPVGAANDPNGLNAGWANGVRKHMGSLSEGSVGGAGGGIGSIGKGDAVGIASQYKGLNEYSDTQKLAAFLGADPRGKSNAWCAKFVNKSLAEAGGQGTGSAVANSFQRWGTGVADHNAVQRNDVLVQTKGLGPDQTGGHVGFATGKTRMHNGKLQLQMLGGNQGDSVSEQWVDSNSNLMVRRGQNLTSQVPSPADTIKNVPTPPAPMSGGPGGSGWGGQATIHINGNSHDPEALAALVQRRVDESMQWRTHDTESEYT
ncbi:uncharacterized protein (TIGR02594 family) [Bradyrhizobium sp. AZCC 1610]|uniref:phage tail tape measure protein n=1 Tax=Bradyrhizobium sp. AZCC 1610 TaxID=3117020 RepID=UPI002FF27D59